MAVRSKQELRDIFVTGHKPTQQEFTDFIDSYIASINGNMPNKDGEIEVPIPFTVSPGIPVDGAPRLYPLGRTIGMFDYVPGENEFVDGLLQPFGIGETTITVVTDRFGEKSVVIQQVDINRDGAFIPSLTRTSNMEQTEWGELQSISNVRTINGQKADINGEIVIPTGGEQGPQGEQGPVGPQGEQGPTGSTGPQGPQGIQGERGEKGERGQGLDIKASYQTVAEANADIANIPDNTFVYISNDENNEGRGSVYFRHDGITTLEFQFVAEGIKGEKGEPGERGEQGSIGPQGPQGPQGTRGIQGIQGIQGPRGEKGDKGEDGESFDLSMIPAKEWACAVSNANQAITGTNFAVKLGEVQGDIPFNEDKTIFTLKGGKTYRLTFYAGVTFNNSIGTATFNFYNNDIQADVGLISSSLVSPNNTNNQNNTGVLDFIFPINNTETNLSVHCGVNSGSNLTLQNSQTYLIIQEL